MILSMAFPRVLAEEKVNQKVVWQVELLKMLLMKAEIGSDFLILSGPNIRWKVVGIILTHCPHGLSSFQAPSRQRQSLVV